MGWQVQVGAQCARPAPAPAPVGDDALHLGGHLVEVDAQPLAARPQRRSSKQSNATFESSLSYFSFKS